MKKGFFFSLDAFLAATLMISILVIMTQHIDPGAPQQETIRLSQDAMTALSAVTMKEIQDPWVQARIADGTIDDPDASVVLQLGKFWALNETSNADTLSGILLTNVLPSGYDVDVYMEDELLYNASSQEYFQQAAARRMVSGVAKGEALSGSTGAAFLHKVSDKRTNAYAFFGGFVGQGNVSAVLKDLPSDIGPDNIQSITLEGEFDDDFTVWINNTQCGGTFSQTPGDLSINTYDLIACNDTFEAGDTEVKIQFDSLNNGSISGGFLRLEYVTDEFTQFLNPNNTQQYLPGIEGIINLYDGLTVPGTLENLSLYLNFEVFDEPRMIYFDIGNVTVYEANASGPISFTLPDTYLRSFLDYSQFTESTIPFRFGYSDGNNTNSSGNITDVFLLTSRHHSMDQNDIYVDATTNRTRIEQVKIVDELFVNIVLGATGNKLGLVSFGTGASVDLDSDVSTDNATLQATIDGYSAHPADAQRYLCGALEMAKTELLNEGGTRNRVIMFMTDGDLKKPTGNTPRCDGSPTNNLELIWEDTVKQACDFVDPVHGNPENITFYAVAFGPEAATNPAIIGNLSLMAECTGGQFAVGTNASELEDIYATFATNISASSVVFDFQRITSSTGVASNLYPDSFFNLTYTSNIPEPGPTQLEVTFQTEPFNSCTPTINFPVEMEVTSAMLNSYSGDYWTKTISVDGTPVYDLTTYGDAFALLGDPARVFIPGHLLNDTSHAFNIVIGANSTDDQGCSNDNTLIYSALVNTSVSRGSVQPTAEGCIWTIEFEDGGNITAPIPQGYTGGNTCSYTSTNISYDTADSYDEVVYRLLDNLDFDDDGQIFVNLDTSDLEVVVTIVSNVPYLWGPSIARVVVSR